MGSFSISSLEGGAQLRVLTSWSLLTGHGVPSFDTPVGPLKPPPGFPLSGSASSPRRVADFSIRSLLALGSSEGPGQRGHQEELSKAAAMWGATPECYAWIHCSRFKPPRLARKIPPFQHPWEAKRGSSPSRASRSPRVPFSAAQIGILEGSYQQTRYLSSGQVGELAALLGLSKTQVKIWFQNRRARERRDFLKERPNSTTLEGTELADPGPYGVGLVPAPALSSTRTLPLCGPAASGM